MMKIMPITMAGMFVILPISSGLAVYILTSSLVGIGQQWWLNRTHPLPAAGSKEAQGKPAREATIDGWPLMTSAIESVMVGNHVRRLFD